MATGIFVTARMGSTRLADKHLRLIDGRPALSYLLKRIDAEFDAELRSGQAEAVLVTGAESRNAALAAVIAGTGVSMYHGDDDNVPLRHLQAARALGIDRIISIDGDDLFCAPEAMRQVHELLNKHDGVVKTTGLPLGMNCWGYDVQTLSTALDSANLALLETGWGRIFAGLRETEVDISCPQAQSIRATLDYEDDLRFFTQCMLDIPDWMELDTASFVDRIIERRLYEINAGLNETYWQNFASGMAREDNTRASTT